MNTNLVVIGKKIWEIVSGSYYGDSHKIVSIMYLKILYFYRCDGFNNIDILIYGTPYFNFKLN